MDIRQSSVNFMLNMIGNSNAKEKVSDYLVENIGLDRELADAYAQDAYDEVCSAYDNDFKFKPNSVVELLKKRNV